MQFVFKPERGTIDVVFILRRLQRQRTATSFFRSVMSLYEVAKTRVRVDSELSEEFEVKVGMS